MKEEKYTCYRCKKEWNLNYDSGAYVLSHVSLTGQPIMGDNRITKELYFCRECFGFLFALLTPKDITTTQPNIKSEYQPESFCSCWVTFNEATGEVIKVEPYSHQDGNFSNLCASNNCRCSD